MSLHSTLSSHLQEPHVSLEAHVHRVLTDLNATLASRRAYYLDMKYWIILRDVAVGRRNQDKEVKLLQLLRDQVTEGQAYCPISESTFFELLKQRDPATRLATARLIDELSLGVTLIPYEARVAMELRSLLHQLTQELGTPEPSHLPWTKLCYVFGQMHPANTGFDVLTELAIQKAFFDKMGSMSLEQMVETIGDHALPADPYPKLATTLNTGNALHAEELRTFPQTYGIEAAGAAEVFAAIAAQAIEELAARTRQVDDDQATNKEASVRAGRVIIQNVLTSEKLRSRLPSLHIHTCLHACLRWDKGHQFEANDFPDFVHACSALAYCDLFLTERALEAMVTAKHVALDTLYGCKVAATVPDALTLLESAA